MMTTRAFVVSGAGGRRRKRGEEGQQSKQREKTGRQEKRSSVSASYLHFGPRLLSTLPLWATITLAEYHQHHDQS